MEKRTEELLALLDREHSLRKVSLCKPPATTIWGDAAAEIRRLQAEVKSLRAFKASVDEALNMGDGTYKP